MATVVCNASPLIILAKADLLKVIPQQFKKIIVPEAVYNEIKAGPDDDPMRNQIDSFEWIEKVVLNPPLTPLAYWRLGLGESEVIEYARTQRNSVALLDDRAARKVATALGVNVMGTLSVTIQEIRKERSLSIGAIVGRLRKAGLYLDNRVVDEVKKRLTL